MNLVFAREVGLPKFLLRQALLRLLHFTGRKTLRQRLPTGCLMHLPSWSYFARDVFVTGADVDWGSELLFSRHLNPSGDFLDVGANIGYYSLFMAPAVRRVFSFEPDPRNQETLGLNAVEGGNIHIRQTALSDSCGEASLEQGAESSVSRLSSAPDTLTRQSVSVRITTLDTFVESEPSVRITGIKLDTEGHELPILRGGIGAIRRDQPLILAELMRWPGQGGEEAFADFQAYARTLDYTIFAYTPVNQGLLRPARFRLKQLSTPELFAAHPTKMIFLVPARLAESFRSECLHNPDSRTKSSHG